MCAQSLRPCFVSLSPLGLDFSSVLSVLVSVYRIHWVFSHLHSGHLRSATRIHRLSTSKAVHNSVFVAASPCNFVHLIRFAFYYIIDNNFNLNGIKTEHFYPATEYKNWMTSGGECRPRHTHISRESICWRSRGAATCVNCHYHSHCHPGNGKRLPIIRHTKIDSSLDITYFQVYDGIVIVRVCVCVWFGSYE